MTISRLALLAPNLDGGIGRTILNLSAALCKKGAKVHVLVGKRNPDFDDAIDARVRLHYMPTTHPVTGVPWLAAFFVKHKPQGVLTSNTRLTQLALNARRLACTHFPVAVNVHSTYSRHMQPLAQSKLEKRKRKIRKYYDRCQAVVCVSEGVMQDFLQFCGRPFANVVTIYNPIVDDALMEKARSPVPYDWFHTDTPIIIGMGRISAEKNFSLLIEAFDRVRGQRSCRLAIVGDGAGKDELAATAAASKFPQDIQLFGFDPNPYRLMHASQVLVLSSNYEGLPSVLVEALAAGTHVVSTDCPHGPREILLDGRLGGLVPVGDAAALAAAIVEKLDAQKPAQVPPEILARFGASSVADKYLSLFASASH